MKILGIGGQGYRDSSAALVVDGRVVAAASEGRFSRLKHQGGFPKEAVEFCLSSGGLALSDLDWIALANNPWLNLRKSLVEWYGESFLESPRFKTFHIFHDELHATVGYLAEVEGMSLKTGGRIEILRHHLCHLAEAYYLSPFSDAAILGIDGRGQMSTSSRGIGRDGDIEVFNVEEMPNSIGLLCAAVADFLGFRDEDDEFRIMSISSLGESRYLETFQRILRPAPNGGYLLNHEYFDTHEGRAFLSDRFSDELGGRREPGEPVDERHADIAASLQHALEEVVLHMARHLHDQTGLDNLCLTGGVAQNWVLGGRLRTDGPFANVYTGFAPGDDGTALGAALAVHSRERPGSVTSGGLESTLGPAFTREEVLAHLVHCGLAGATPADPVDDAAGRIAAGRLVGWFEGRMEFGPRALGHRSIFLDPTNPAAKEKLVERVKPRARYHPFGITVPETELERYFEDVRPDPQMASHRRVRPEEAEALSPILHTDGTARVQTVGESSNGSLRPLLAKVKEKTGHAVLLNTSLNVPGKPLVLGVRDALATFYTTGLDDIFIEGVRLSKPGDQA